MTFAKVTGSLTLTVLSVSLVVRFVANIDLTTSRTLFSLGLGPSVINSRRILIIAFLLLHKKKINNWNINTQIKTTSFLKQITHWSYKIGGEVVLVVRVLAVKENNN